jgi:hypothetical protein
MQHTEAMAQKDRISVDISDMKDEIQACRSDASWEELSLTGKIRTLLRERLDQLQGREDRIDALIRKLGD